MRIILLRSWVLTDELPLAAKGTPVLIDIETRKIYQPGDSIMGISAQQVVSLAVEAIGENYLLPEQTRFISRFTSADLPSQCGHEPLMGNVKKLTYQKMQFLMREGNQPGPALRREGNNMQIEVLSYAEEKRNRLSWEYGEAKVDEVDGKMKPLWENLSIKLREHIAERDLLGTKKTVDEYFKLVRKEIIKTFN